jgi:hypothetical protein
MKICARDDAILRFLAEVGQAPVDVIASRWFVLDSRTGKPTKDPVHAAERRLGELRKAGLLHRVLVAPSSRGEAAGGVVMLESKAASLLGVRPKKVHARHRHHHFQTLRLVEEVRVDLEKQGRQVVKVLLEDELRAQILSKRERYDLHKAFQNGSVNLNDEKWAVPDAVVVVMGADGKEEMVAVEYLSATYREEDLQAKMVLLSSTKWSRSVVAADTKRTVKRALAVGLVKTTIIGPALERRRHDDDKS